MASPLHNSNENELIEQGWKALRKRYDNDEEIHEMRKRFVEEAKRQMPDDESHMQYIVSIAHMGIHADYPAEKIHLARTLLNWESMDEKKERRRSIRG